MGTKKNIENNIADLTAKMESLGIYRTEYDIAIRNLAENMEARNQAWKRYMSGDGTLKDYRDLDSRVLEYLKELSLTEQRRKRRAEAGAKLDRNDKKKLTLFDAISNISEEES